MFPFRDHNPSNRPPIVTITLILANLAVFFVTLPAQLDNLDLYEIYNTYALLPARVMSGEGYMTLLTSAFLHAGVMHLVGNMLFLWVFGDNMEEQLGHVGFLLFYLLSAVAAGYAQILSDPTSMIPMIGASGAVAGVMGGYLLFFPKARVDVLIFLVVFIRIIPIPAWVVLGVWFGLQLLNGASVSVDEGGVAYWAHAGGFIAGILFSLPVWLSRGGQAFWERVDYHPPHKEAEYEMVKTSVPRVTRNKN